MQQIRSYFQRTTLEEYQLQVQIQEAAKLLRNCERQLQKIEREKEEKIKKDISDLLQEVVDKIESNDLAEKMLDTAGIFNGFMEGFDDANSNNVGKHASLAISSTNKKHHHKRPSNWMEMAQFASLSTIRKAAVHYRDAGYFLGLTDEGIYNNIRRYLKNYREWLAAGDKQLSFKETIGGSKVSCGEKAFNELKKVAETHYKHEIPLPHYVVTARVIEIVRRFADEGDPDSIKARDKFRDGKLTFGATWVTNFFKKINYSNRAATSKSRNETPADFERKSKTFLYILCKILHDHIIPDSLIVNLDETNTQFVPALKKVRCPRGIRKIGVRGISHYKPQITVTLAAAANGEIIDDTQLIFQGKTARSHPKGDVPFGLYYSHTSSHWQDVYSFIEYVKKVIIPYRERVVTENGYGSDQKMLLMLDLHGSHKKCLKHDTNVTKLLKDNHIICVFIPAGCTDIYQVMDVIVNKIYKSAVRREYILYLHELLEEHLRNPATADEPMIIDFSMSVFKPLISRFVYAGVNSLRSDKIKEAIRQSFLKDALLATARSAETYMELQGLSDEERQYFNLEDVYFDLDDTLEASDEENAEPNIADNANHDGIDADDGAVDVVEEIYLPFENENSEDGECDGDESEEDEAALILSDSSERIPKRSRISRTLHTVAAPVPVQESTNGDQHDTRQSSRRDTRQEDWATAQDVQDIALCDLDNMSPQLREKRLRHNRNFKNSFSSLQYHESMTSSDLAENDYIEVKDGLYRKHRGVVSSCANRGIYVILNVLHDLDTLNITKEIKFQRNKLYKLIAPITAVASEV